MQILKEVRIGRLVFAVFVTLLIADTVPHPGLSAGLVESSLNRMQAEFAPDKGDTAIAEVGQ